MLAASRFVDANVRTVPPLPKVTVPGTATPPAETTTALLPTLAELKGALIAKSTRTFAGTLFAPFAGLTIRTVGADVFVVEPVVKANSKLDSP